MAATRIGQQEIWRMIAGFQRSLRDARSGQLQIGADHGVTNLG
jgi:hypothetical protein